MRGNRKSNELGGVRASDMEAFANGYNIGGSSAVSPNDTLNSRVSQPSAMNNQAPTLKVQDLLRNANNKSDSGHNALQGGPGAPIEDPHHADFMNIHFSN